MSLERAIRDAQCRLPENGEVTIHISHDSMGLVVRWDCENFPDTTAEDAVDVDDLAESIDAFIDAAKEMVDDRMNRIRK